MPHPSPATRRVGFAGSPEWSVRLAPTCIVIIACGLTACGAASNPEAPIDRAVLLVHEAHARHVAADELRCTEEPLRVQRLHSHTVRTCVESSMRSGRHVETGDLTAISSPGDGRSATDGRRSKSPHRMRPPSTASKAAGRTSTSGASSRVEAPSGIAFRRICTAASTTTAATNGTESRTRLSRTRCRASALHGRSSATSTNPLSELERRARSLAVYASRPRSPSHHARLAAGWWPASAGWDSTPLDCCTSLRPAQFRLAHRLPPRPGLLGAHPGRVVWQGVVVIIRCQHFCMGYRGVREPGSWTTTSEPHGIILRDAAARMESFTQVGMRAQIG